MTDPAPGSRPAPDEPRHDEPVQDEPSQDAPGPTHEHGHDTPDHYPTEDDPA